MISYDLNNIKNIKENLTEFELEENVLERIKNLFTLLGVENINGKVKNYKKERAGHDGRWVKKEVFKVTVFEKKEENIDMLRGLLNRLSSKNYEVQKLKIKTYVEELVEDLNVKVNELFLIVILNNGFYIDLYVNLINWLLEEGALQDDFLENFKNIYNDLLENIEYIDPEDDYDKFCLTNKTNDERKNLLSFLCNGTKDDLYSFDEVYDIIKNIFNKIESEIDNREKLNINEELLENVCVFVEVCKQTILKSVSKYMILKNLEKYSKVQTNEYKGFSSRMKFKSMDLLELLKK
tara:strand:+ start:8510 stop:9391 length:882 start_codon:yes stop_codon:yes gene_type:complete